MFAGEWYTRQGDAGRVARPGDVRREIERVLPGPRSLAAVRPDRKREKRAA